MSKPNHYWKGQPLKEMSHEKLCDIVVELHRENKSLMNALQRERSACLADRIYQRRPWLMRFLGL